MNLEELLHGAREAVARERWGDAMPLLQRAVEQQPQSHEGCYLLGQVCYELGKLPEAFQWVRRSMTVRGDHPDSYVLLGHILRAAGHATDAADAYQACLELKPDHITALIALGNLAREQRQTQTARLFYERALQLRPGDPNLQTNLATVLGDVGRTTEAITLLEAALRTNPAAREAHSNLLLTLHYDAATTPERLAAEHRLWAQKHAGDLVRLPLVYDRSPERKLRLGFVSADFKNHPVGRLLEVLWRELDRECFDVVAYDAGTAADSLTALLRQRATQWESLAGLSDDAAAAQIQRDGVDVLFDLSGHSAGNRLLVFARRPAPLQVTWFAYPNTTGLGAMTHRLTDALADPPGEVEERYTEALLRLPHLAWVYRPPDESYPVKPLPHTRGEAFTFGCLNNPAKASPASLAAWGAILSKCPEARLLLLVRNDPDYLEGLERQMEAAGVRPGQLQFVYSGPPQQYYDRHYEVDLMLDPFPYNGAITTADALWMGVPVLSLEGETYASRQGLALLHNLGLDDWLAHSVDDYIQKACALAAQPETLAALQPTLRDRLAGSPVMDYAGFAVAFSDLIRRAWWQACSSA